MSLAEGESRGEITEQSLSRLLERKDVERTRPGAMQRDFLTPSRWAEGDLAKANFVVTSEMNERLARGIGDMNLLFLDPAYARKSPFGRKITPPSMMAYAENVNGAVDGFPGCHAIWRGLEFEWEEPIYTDEPILSSSRLIDAKIVESKFAGGMAAIQSYETRIENLDGQSKGVYRTHWHRFSRKKAASSGKYKKTEEKQWTDEELDAIWEEYRHFEPEYQPEPIWQFSRRRYVWAKDQWPNLSDRITTIWTLQDFGLIPADIDVKTVISVADGKRQMQVKIPAKSAPDRKRETTELKNNSEDD